MPHYKCVACRTRLFSVRDPSERVGDLCPGCGSLLEPVGELSEVVGYRSITTRDAPACAAAADGHQQIINLIDDFVSRREVILGQATLDAEQWLDDGGSSPAIAAAVAQPVPKPHP